MIELFECIPLAARISKRQCETNRKRVDNHMTGTFALAACKGCRGLGAAVDIDVEVGEMALCIIKGCTKKAQIQGQCKSHFHGTTPRTPRAALTSGQAKVEQGFDVVDDSGWVQPVMVQAPVVPSVQEISSIDYIAFLRQLFDAKVEEWVAELNSAANPKERARFYLAMCDAAEGLGF